MLRQYNHYICHHTTISVSVWSHPLYWWYNTHCVCDITPTIYIAQYALHMTSHPQPVSSQHSIHDIKAIISHITPIISDSTSTLSLSSHPDYWSYIPLCMYDNTASICMTSYELHMISHPLLMISHHTMTSHPLCSCHHTQYTFHGIQCCCTIAYSVLIIPPLLYVWHQTHYMYDITWILCDITLTLYEITILYSSLHIHSIHDSTPTLYDIIYSILVPSHMLYLWHHSHCIYEKTPPMFMTSYSVYITFHMLYEWQYNHGIWHHIHCIGVTTLTWLMIS